MTITDVKDAIGQQLYDDDGEPIGTVERIILDHNTQDPEWLAVRLATEDRIVPVPLGGLRGETGDRLVFFKERSVVGKAPEVDLAETLDPKDEGLLYEHFGVPRPYIKGIAEGVRFTDEGEMLVPVSPGFAIVPRPEGYPEDEWDIAFGTSNQLSIDEAFKHAYSHLNHLNVTDGKMIEVGFQGSGLPGSRRAYVILAQRQSSPLADELVGGEMDDLTEE